MSEAVQKTKPNGPVSEKEWKKPAKPVKRVSKPVPIDPDDDSDFDNSIPDDDFQHAGEDDMDPVPLNMEGTKTGRVSAAKPNKANGPKSAAPNKVAAKKVAPASVAKVAPFDSTYEFEHEGEALVFTKRRALAFKAYIDTGGEADPEIVAADMEKEFGPAKKGTHLASARRIRGTYLKLKAAGVIK